MTPGGRVAEIKRLTNQIVDNDSIHDENCIAIRDHVDALVDALRNEIKVARDLVDEADGKRFAAEERLDEIEGALTWKDERPIWYEAKGRIMEGQDPKTVLAWVLTWVSGEDILL